MKKIIVLTGALLIVAGCKLGVFSSKCHRGMITEIEKPADMAPIKKAMTQEALPTTEEWKENPYIETAPIPIFTKNESKRGYIIFSRAISDIVYPNSSPKSHERINELTGFGCRGEFEPLTFTIYPNRELRNLKVRISNLVNGKASIPASEISVRLQTYWKIPYPHYVTAKSYQWRLSPELLEKVTVHTSPSKQCQRYWLTIHVPKNAKPGIYFGQVSIWDDGYAKAVVVPVRFRIMSFDLLKDPRKHYTAYYYDYLWGYDKTEKNKSNNEWVMKAALNSYKSMKDHGFDAMPTVYLRYNRKTDEVYARNGDRVMRTAKKAGFKNIPFVPVAGGNAIAAIIRKYDRKFKRPSHWRISPDKMPNEKVYSKITELFKKFNDKWKSKGYPKIYCCPLDEIAPSAWKFGKKIYAAVKKSGMGVYITKSPATVDAHHYNDVVDAFCCQPYALPYEQVVKSGTERNWCYPNHNSWETRKPTVMCNGGRMTYGFGNWRSGYSVLMPWAWNCRKTNKPISYFNPSKRGYKTYRTPGGNPADANGEVVPTTYWQCFRAGYDDARYIYTLQQMIVEREKNANPACGKLVAEGKALLQKIWDDIKVQQKYKEPSTVSILPREFDALRWRMAIISERLSRYKGDIKVTAPSVIVETSSKQPVINVLERERKRGNLITKSLGDETFDYWKSVAGELKTSITDKKHVTGAKSLKLDIKIDYNTDGGGEKGKYPIGWPRIKADFKKNELDLTKYEYLRFDVMVDSDRDEVADDFTPAYWTFASHKRKGSLAHQKILGQVPQRVWIPVMIPLSKLMDGSNRDLWKSISHMQFGIGEGHYADKTHLTFYLDDISLVSFKTPILETVLAPSTILLPAKGLYCKIKALGTAFIKNGEYKIKLQLIGEDKMVVASDVSELKGCASMTLKLKNVQKGEYSLKGEIVNVKSGKAVSIWQKQITAVDGP